MGNPRSTSDLRWSWEKVAAVRIDRTHARPPGNDARMAWRASDWSLRTIGARGVRNSNGIAISRGIEKTVNCFKLILAIVAFQPQNTLHIKKGTWVFKNCGQKPT